MYPLLQTAWTCCGCCWFTLMLLSCQKEQNKGLLQWLASPGWSLVHMESQHTENQRPEFVFLFTCTAAPGCCKWCWLHVVCVRGWEPVTPVCSLPLATCGFGCFGGMLSKMPLFLPAAETGYKRGDLQEGSFPRRALRKPALRL